MAALVGNRSSTSGSVPPPWWAFRTVSVTAEQTADHRTHGADDKLFDCVLRNN